MWKIKRRRERDLARVVRFFMWYGVSLGALVTIGAWTGIRVFSLKLLLPLVLVPIPFCILSDYVVERLGSGLGGFLSGWSSRRASLHETLGADLQKARYSKREGRLPEALGIIDGVLEKDPNFTDALFLKAQILRSDVRRAGEAKECLRKVMKSVPKDEALHQWASSYYNEVVEAEKKEYARDS